MEGLKLLTLIAFLLCLLIQNVSSQDLLSSGATIALSGVSYYISDEPFASGYENIYTAGAATSKVAFGLLPVTVIDLGPAAFSPVTLEQSVERFEEQDDVWSRAFLAGENSRLKMAYARYRSVGVEWTLNFHRDSYHPTRYISRQLQY